MLFFLLRVSLALLATAAFPQSTRFEPPRRPDGHPDFQGVWRNSAIVAAFSVEGQEAFFNEPGGPSVIVDPPGGKLPYLPGALKQANDNHVHRERDPTGHCHTHGIPRALVPPFPIEIVEDRDHVVLLSETEHTVRIIPVDGSPHRKNYRAWAGDSRGRWEGDTLVVDVAGFNGRTWLDQSGNFTDENEHVVERFTMTSADTIRYEARVEDPTVFSQPWTMRLSLRRQPQGTELIEYDCIEGERSELHYPGAKN
jgi:hypothetical protein